MAREELNLGILAHVDAGKTTLTERLLYEAGAIRELGSVAAGTTQTDSLALEQQRGITIRSAVASFAIGDVHVNLIDTPGHPDFIAEVERVLGVLDGAVLVVSAVEGVQPQTRILMRALKRLRVPTLVFVNKIDRAGADDERVLRAIAERLTPAIAPLDDHERLAEAVAEHDEAILAAYVEEGPRVPYERLRDALASQSRRAVVHPVLFGSALTGAGVPELMRGVAELLPSAAGDPDGPVAARVFKIERGGAGEKIAYVRMFSGTVRTRDTVRFGSGDEAKVTSLAVFEEGGAVQRPHVSAGAIAKLWGLREVRVGDRLGEPGVVGPTQQFPPPTLESVVVARHAADRARLRVALAQLAEQDPLIDVRQDDDMQELTVSLYGEVQKEVVESTLASDFGVEVEFRETTPLYVERPLRTGEAEEVLHAATNPYLATMGLRVDPAPRDSGVAFRADVDPRTTPLFLYRTFESFVEHMDEYVRDALRSGLLGWRVTDCVVSLTRCAYSIPDGPPSRRGPPSTAADFRKLTPLVALQALERAGTVVCEPTLHVRIELPPQSIHGVVSALVRLGAPVDAPSIERGLAVLETRVPASRLHELQRRLPALSGGEGVLESSFAGYEPISDDARPAPARARRG